MNDIVIAQSFMLSLKQYNTSCDTPNMWSFVLGNQQSLGVFPRISRMMHYLVLCNYSSF